MLNNYDALAKDYQRSAVKPDKLYSTLPTVLSMVGDVQGKVIVDLGCGAGFFTNEFARRGATKVIGIDSSEEQIALANQTAAKHTEYQVGNIFSTTFPRADVIVAPYVLNYAESVEQLQSLVRNVFSALPSGGLFAAVLDIPEGKDLKRFGAIKTVEGDRVDGAPIQIQLFDGAEHICTLHAIYFTEATVVQVLSDAGFTNVVWHVPVISDEGIESMGEDFWKGYVDSPELAYVTAVKP